MRFFTVWIITSFSFLLAGCAGMTDTKAPCNYYGTFCGPKKHINP